MTAKWIPLAEWAAAQYGDSAPCMNTLRRWARDARIFPAPEKHGRSYVVSPDARYVDPANPVPTPQPEQQSGRLINRLTHGR